MSASIQSTPWDFPVHFSPVDQMAEEWQTCLSKMKQNEALFYQEKLKTQAIKEELQVLKAWAQKSNQEKEWVQKSRKEHEEKLTQKIEELKNQLETTRLELFRTTEKLHETEKKKSEQLKTHEAQLQPYAQNLLYLRRQANALKLQLQKEKAHSEKRNQQLQGDLLLSQNRLELTQAHFKKLRALASQCYQKYLKGVKALELIQKREQKEKKQLELYQKFYFAHRHEKKEAEHWRQVSLERQTALETLKEELEEGKKKNIHLFDQLAQEKREKTLALSYFHTAEAKLNQLLKQSPSESSRPLDSSHPSC